MRRLTRFSGQRVDLTLGLLLFAGIVVYLSTLPRNLNQADESYFLYEAKRIGEGQVMYRDVFQFVTPLASYAMSGLFWLFGTSMATARIATACLHALTGVMLFATGRRLGVRTQLALLVPLAYLITSEAVWPSASWHWFSTCCAAILLYAMVAGPWANRPGWAVVPGLLSGLLIGLQQQRGIPVAAGAGAVLVLDFLLDLRYPQPPSWRVLTARIGYFTAGVAAVVIPLLLVFVLWVGVDALYDALVRFPLQSYRPHFRTSWGAVGPMTAVEYTYSTVLTYSPLALALPLVEFAVAFARGRDRQRARQLCVLLVLSGAAALSIGYYPDVIHIAFIVGIFWVAAVVGVEWVLRALQPVGAWHAAETVVLAAAALALVLQLVSYARLRHAQFPVAHQTAFGRIDFASRWEPVFIDKVRELVAATPTHELFCYSQLAAPYLTTGGRNPTPYQKLISGVSPPAQIQRSLRILESRRVPYVVTAPLWMPPNDPINKYIAEHYEYVSMPEVTALDEPPIYSLYRRKDSAAAEPSSTQ